MSEFTFGEFEELVHDFNEPLLVCFYRRFDSDYLEYIKKVEKDLGMKYNIIKVDVSNNVSIPRSYFIMQYPSLVIFANGDRKWTFSDGRYSTEYIDSVMKMISIQEQRREIDLCGTVLS